MKNSDDPRENDAQSPTIDGESRHAGSIPAARTDLESSSCESSVEPGVEVIGRYLEGSKKYLDDLSVAEVRPWRARNILPSETGQYYLPDGTPFYTVPYAESNREKRGQRRRATLSDARRVNAFPSTTTIFKLLRHEGLENYRDNQVFQATLRVLIEKQIEESRVPRFVKLDLDELYRRVLIAASEHRDNAMDRGRYLHAEIERYLRGEPLYDAPRFWPCVDELVRALGRYGIDIHQGATEKSFAHPLGFGGKVDWHRCINPVVLDLKSKEQIDDSLVQSWLDDTKSMQLAAYRVGLGIPNARGINVFVGEKDRKIRICEWTHRELKSAWCNFKDLLSYWKRTKHYYPKPKKSDD